MSKNPHLLLAILLVAATAIAAGCSSRMDVDSIDFSTVPNSLNFNQIEDPAFELAKQIGLDKEIFLDLWEHYLENESYQQLLDFHITALFERGNIEDEYKGIADNLARRIRQIGVIDGTIFENYEIFREKGIQFNHVIRTTNEHFSTTIPEIDLSIENHQNLRGFKAVTTYVPVIESYNKLYNTSLKLPSETNEDYQNFYMNLFLFGADVAFVQQKVGYNAAFKSTGTLANAIGLSGSRAVLGDKGYGLLLSQIHWTIRGELQKGWEDLLDALRQESLIG